MLASISRLVEAGAWAAGVEEVGLPADLPHSGEQDVGHLRIEREVGGTCAGIDVEDLLPRLPAIGGLEYAPLFVAVPCVAGGADVDCVAGLRIDGDARDVLAVGEAGAGPVRAAVGGLVDAAADRNTVTHPRLARTDPHRRRLRRIDGDGPDGLCVVVEDGVECETAVRRLPDAAAGRAGVDRCR